jgi:predicted AAA+ superfamily ATPase
MSNAVTGRTEILERMERRLLNAPRDGNSLRIMTFYVLRGVGKTQLAVEYAKLFRHR